MSTSVYACGDCGTAACGCCSGIASVTPLPTVNRPGLTSLRYRIGTHGRFLETMKARLALHELQGKRPLSKFTTRLPSDASIALLDAWACVGDVLTFYQERIANEGYLRTATELRSVYELARLVGYRPRPGVAASVYLAYTIDDNTKEEVLIAKGARVQSIPGPGETAQSFETSEDLKARARWNRLRVRTHQPQRLASIRENGHVYVQSVSTNLNANDPLLILESDDAPELFRITEVTVDTERGQTLLAVEPWGKQTAKVKEAASPSLRRVIEILDEAPPGRTSGQIVTKLATVREWVLSAGATEHLPADKLLEAYREIEFELQSVRFAAPRLRRWASDLRAALIGAAGVTDLSSATTPARISAVSLVNRLSKPPSQPRPNALELPRSLDESFSPTSDAGLQALGALAPGLKDAFGAALAGQSDPDAENTLKVYAFRARVGVFGRNAQPIQELLRDENAGTSRTRVISEWPIIEYIANIRNESVDVVAHENASTLWLDNSYEGITPGSWIAIDAAAVDTTGKSRVGPAEPLIITRPAAVHSKITRRDYGLSGDTTRLALRDAWLTLDLRRPQDEDADPPSDLIDRDFRVIRGTTVFARAELLPLAEEPIEAQLCGGTVTGERDSAKTNRPVELDGLYQDLEPGRFVVLCGERTGLGDGAVVRASEALMISSVTHDVRAADGLVPWTDAGGGIGNRVVAKLPSDTIHTFVWFDRPLSYCYRRDTVTIYGNTVKATHGETSIEILGSGDGAKALQSFALKQHPLTYLAAPTAAGAESTLEVFANDLRWHEQDTFVDRMPAEKIFVTRTDEAGRGTVVFGNGIEGARVPTGIANIKAQYRFGIGKAGNVRAEQISQLSTRPLGVKEVINPLRASGGADREGRDQARRNAPNAVMALDRLVSTRDYADFARSFAGIGKAASVELSNGTQSIVHVTIAGEGDIPIGRDSDLFLNLRRALRDLGDPFQPVQLATRDLLMLIIAADIHIDPDYRWEVVVSTLRAKLLETFGFDRRELGQDVTRSEVLSAMQSVRGVLYVDLNSFGAIRTTTPDVRGQDGQRPLTPEEIAAAVRDVAQAAPATRVIAAMARLNSGGTTIVPAEVAVLIPDAPATLVLNRIA